MDKMKEVFYNKASQSGQGMKDRADYDQVRQNLI